MAPADLAAWAMPARRAGSPANAAISEASAIGREIALLDPDRPAGRFQYTGIDELILIQGMRQRHQDRRPADSGKLGDGRCA